MKPYLIQHVHHLTKWNENQESGMGECYLIRINQGGE